MNPLEYMNIDGFYTSSYMERLGLSPIGLLCGLTFDFSTIGELNLDLGLLIGSFSA